jgi:hypothetical protein
MGKANRLALRYLGLANVGFGILTLANPALCAEGSVFFAAPSEINELQWLGLVRFGYGCELLAIADSSSDPATQSRTLSYISVPFFGQALMLAMAADSPHCANSRLAVAWSLENFAHAALTAYIGGRTENGAETQRKHDYGASSWLMGIQCILAFGQAAALMLVPDSLPLEDLTTTKALSGLRFTGAVISVYGFLGLSLYSAERSTHHRVLHYFARGVCCLQLGRFLAVEVEKYQASIDSILDSIGA